MEGWIKFYRQVNENEIFRHDRTAWHIFEVLLIQCRYGVWKGGRFQLAEFCDENANTIYKALKRLEKAKMVTLSSNNRFTTISILNWDKYQGSSNSSSNTSGNNKVTTEQQQSNTSIRIKNKELRIKENTDTKVSLAKPTGDLQNLIDFSTGKNFPIQGTIKMNRYNASNLLKKFGLEKSKKLVLAAVDCRGKPYAPQVNDFMQLYRKCGDLVNYYAKEKNERNKNIIG